MKTTALLGVSLALFALSAQAQVNFEKATITYIQKDVAVADIKLLYMDGNEAKKTNAFLNQIITKNNAVVTGDKSRAELKFNDGSVARLGQFSVFSFKEGTREIDLQQGSALMNVPKGMGRTNIKAAAITAAITGTTVLFQAFDDFVAIYVYEGTVEGPHGKTLGPGEFVIFKNGKYRTDKFDISKGVGSAALFTKFTASPNANNFSLEQILRLVAQQKGTDLPKDLDYSELISAIPNREIDILILDNDEKYNNEEDIYEEDNDEENIYEE